MFFARFLAASIFLFSNGISWFFFSILRVRRKVVLKNLELAFGNSSSSAEKIALARISLSSFLRTVLEFVFSPWIYPFSKVEFRNLEKITRPLASGRGIYALAIHQGNWELLCHKGGKHVARLYLSLKPVGGARVSEWVRKRREENCVHEVMRNSAVPAWAQIHERIAEGAIVGFVMDQRRKKGVVAPLFGEVALTNVSLFRQWRGMEAPIIPLTIRRTGLLTHEVLFWDELEVWNETGATEDDFYRENAKRMNIQIEKMIRWNAKEYFWLHDRWKL